MAAIERRLYGTPISVYCCKLRLALALKGLDLPETPPPGGYASAAYRAIVPQGTIPALVEGDFVLAESDAIVEYLDEIGAGHPLMPEGAQARAWTRALSRFIDTRLEPAARALFPLVGTGNPVPQAMKDALRHPLDTLAQLAGDGPYLMGSATPGLADCGFWAVSAVLEALDGALGLDLTFPDSTGAGDRIAACAGLLSAYRAALADWMSQKMEGA